MIFSNSKIINLVTVPTYFPTDKFLIIQCNFYKKSEKMTEMQMENDS